MPLGICVQSHPRLWDINELFYKNVHEHWQKSCKNVHGYTEKVNKNVL